MPLYTHTKRAREKDMASPNRLAHLSRLSDLGSVYARARGRAASCAGGSSSSALSASSESDTEEVGVNPPETEQGPTGTAQGAGAELSASPPLIETLTNAILNTICRSNRSVSFFMSYQGGGGAGGTSSTPSLTTSSLTREGRSTILAVLEECKRRKQYFDEGQLGLFVVVFGERNQEVTGSSSVDGRNDVVVNGPLTTTSARPFRLYATTAPPSSEGMLNSLVSPLAAITKLLGSPSNRKLLVGVGSFWAPFLLQTVGAGKLTVANVLDVGTVVAAFGEAPGCGLVDKKRLGNDAQMLAQIALAEREQRFGESLMAANLTNAAQQQFPSQPLSQAALQAQQGELIIVRAAYGLQCLNEDVMVSVDLLCSSGGGSMMGKSSSLLPSSSATTHSSVPLLLAHALRESEVQYALAAMAHTGMHVDACSAIATLDAFTKRSQRIHKAIDAVILNKLVGGPSSSAAAVDGSASSLHPQTDADLLALVNKYPAELIIDGKASNTDGAATSNDEGGQQPPLTVTAQQLRDPSFIAKCPIAACWAQLKRLQDGGVLLQRLLKPLLGQVEVSMQRAKVTKLTATIGATHSGAHNSSSSSIPLCEVHPEFHANSFTGRIFTANPNVQTVKGTTITVSSGSAAGDTLVEKVLSAVTGGVTTTAQSEQQKPPLSPLPTLSVNLRSFFVAPPGTRMLSFDFNQIELRVLAHLSKDPSLLRAFGVVGGHSDDDTAGAAPSHVVTDVLRFVAKMMFGLPSEEAVASHHRTQAKVVVYGMLYGMGDRALQQRLGELAGGGNGGSAEGAPVAGEDGSKGGDALSTAGLSAADLRAAFTSAFPTATAYLRQVGTDAILTHQMTTMGGKYKRTRGEEEGISNGNGDELQPLFTDHYTLRNQAVSMRIQGSAADILKEALCEVVGRRSTTTGAPSWGADTTATSSSAPPPPPAYTVIMTLHDELLVLVPDTEASIAAATQHIQHAMEAVGSTFGMSVPLKVNVKMGADFGSLRAAHLPSTTSSPDTRQQ